MQPLLSVLAPPLMTNWILTFRISSISVIWGHNIQTIKHSCKFCQAPFLLDMARQYPFSFWSMCDFLPNLVLFLDDFNLLIWMDISPLWRQAGYDRAWKKVVGQSRVCMNRQSSPVM